MQLEGKAALVTGAGRGLGRSIALAYAQEGADVAIISRTPTELEQVAEEIRALGRRGLAITADLTDSQQTHRAVQEAIDGLGRLDILVNNAGGYRLFTDDLAHAIPFLDLSEEVWDRVMSSNLTTAFLCCKAVLPHMVEQGSGAIINMSSGTVASKGRAGQAAYCASKAALERLSESIAEDVRVRHSGEYSESRLGPDQAQRRLRFRGPQADAFARRYRPVRHSPRAANSRDDDRSVGERTGF